MNITINTEQTTSIYQIQNNQDNTTSAIFTEGSIVAGIIGKVSDMISINFQEKTVDISKEMLPNAKEGDTVNFEVTKSEDGATQLKIMEQTSANEVLLSSATQTEIVGETLEVEGDETNSQTKSEDAAKATDLAGDIKNQMTDEDYADLSKEGYSLEKYEMERLDRALDRIKDSREQLEEQTDNQKSEIQDYQDMIEDISLSNIMNGPLKDQIASMIENAGLPVTKANVQAAASSIAMAKEASGMTDSAMTYLLQNNLSPTSMNLYKASYSTADGISGGDTATQDSQESSGYEQQMTTSKLPGDWEQLLDQVSQVVDEMQQEGSQATIEDAKWLYERDLPINTEVMEQYQNLSDLRDNFSVSGALENIISGMASGQNACDVDLSVKSDTVKEQVIQAVNGFAAVTDEAVQTVVSSGKEVTLSNLETAMQELSAAVEETSDDTNLQNDSSSGQTSSGQGQSSSQSGMVETTQTSEQLQKELELITARRQLEEIRVKLTYDAGLSLVNKGVNIDTEGLDTIVNELRTLEDSYYEKLLSEAGVSTETSNTELLKSTLTQVESLKQAPCAILGTTLASQDEVTLQTLANEGENLQAKLTAANSAYEPLMTAPRSDLGDSIQKAFQNVDDLLSEMDMDTTEANRRAVRILGYNQMEITQESVEEMKAYDLSVTQFVEQLTPSTAVELIKNKINPLDTPISEVSDLCEQIKEENGSSDEEKYSNYLTKIQKSDTLSESERDTYIGLYRLLNNVEKTDGKAIGYLVKSEREITLNNLLSAVRTVNGQGIDASVDDSFGSLSSLTYQGNSISDQLESTFDATTDFEQAKVSYQEKLNQGILEQIQPGSLGELAEEETLLDSTLEQVYEQVQSYDGQDAATGYQEFIQGLDIVASSTDAVKFLKDYGCDTSIDHVKAAKDITENADVLYRDMADVLGTDEIFTTMESEFLSDTSTYEEAVNQYQESLDEVSSSLKAMYGNPSMTVDDMARLNGYLKDTSLLSELGTQNFCQIPMEVDGKLIGVSVSLNSSSEEKGKVSVSLDSDTFGQVEAQFQLNGKEISGLVIYENASSETLMQRTLEDFTTQIKEQGLEVKQLNQGLDSTYFESYHFSQGSSEDNDSVMTQDLFTTAKQFITCIKTIN